MQEENPIWERLRELPLHIRGASCTALELAADGGWKRRTTVVQLDGGDGRIGRGEDVTYDRDEQLAFQRRFAELRLAGEFTIEEFSAYLDSLVLVPDPPAQEASRAYRRWAFESAALDLALWQAGRTLQEVVGRAPQPVAYALSLGLGSPPTLGPIRERLERWPGARFKVDWAADWTREVAVELGALGVVDVVDLKGQYRGAFEGPKPSAEGYRVVAEALPDVWLEDPGWDDTTAAALDDHRHRVAWDAVLYRIADLDGLPFVPRGINIKPSRFGRLSEVLAAYAWCEAREVLMYGGGQFELGVGREQVQHLAALFHPASCNDVAPAAFHRWPKIDDGIPGSPMVAPIGFGPMPG